MHGRHSRRYEQAPGNCSRATHLSNMEENSSQVGQHTLFQGGGANALALSRFSDTQIQKMGQWHGATFKEYIWEELANYLDGMSMAIKTKFNFMNEWGVRINFFARLKNYWQDHRPHQAKKGVPTNTKLYKTHTKTRIPNAPPLAKIGVESLLLQSDVLGEKPLSAHYLPP
jgi:hypothetical protein